MKYNFTQFIRPKHIGCIRKNHKGGLTVSKRIAYILEDNFPLEEDFNYERICIYLDLENNAIKIVEGDSYKLTLIKRGSRKYKVFCSVALVKNGLKIGRYKYVGDNTFILEKEKTL